MAVARARMVAYDLERRGIHDSRVLAVMGQIRREDFLREGMGAEPDNVYGDRALPMGRGQTLSQPFVVAAMTQALALTSDQRVLEVGTGSGYQTAVLASIAKEVWTVERDPVLAEEAIRRLGRIGFKNVRTLTGDGTKGWSEGAPYDAILVTAGSPSVPMSLCRQLAAGGRLVVPVGSRSLQSLLRITGRHDGEEGTREVLMECRFVPLVGEEGWRPGWGERWRAVRPS
jgi:protein-L-isoaspartate(D-aspartate) O-methyltransferase